MHFTNMTPFLDRSTPQDAEKHLLAWTVLPADLHTPVRIFLALRDAGRGPCLLESAEGPDRLARYSFFGIDSDQVFKGSFSGASSGSQIRRWPSRSLDSWSPSGRPSS